MFFNTGPLFWVSILLYFFLHNYSTVVILIIQALNFLLLLQIHAFPRKYLYSKKIEWHCVCTFEIIILLSKQPHACKTHIFYWSRKNTAENSRDRRKSNRSMKSSLQTLRCSSQAIKWNQCHWWLVTWVLSETWQSHWKASNSSHPERGRQSCAQCRQGYSIRVQEFWSGTSQDEPCTLDITVSSAGDGAEKIAPEDGGGSQDVDR